MSQILSYLYLGGKNDAKDKDKLSKMKIKYILNCTPQRTDDPESGCPNFYQKEKLFTYKRIAIFDNIGEDVLSHMTTAFNFIEEGKHYGNVLVHCHKGISRSATFVIGYLMRKNEFTLEEALAHVQSCRPIVQPNSSFMEQLTKYKPHSQQEVHERDAKTNDTSLVDIGPSMGPSLGPSYEPSVGLSHDPINNHPNVEVAQSVTVTLLEKRSLQEEEKGGKQENEEENVKNVVEIETSTKRPKI